LACHLLGIETEVELAKSPILGALFEGFLAGEIVKAQVNAGRRRELYYFRDQQGLEVDFVVPARGGGVRLVEAKASVSVMPGMAAPMQRLAAAWKKRPDARGAVRGAVKMLLVHRASRAAQSSRAIAPGVQAVPWQEFVTTELS
jgi:hypothetical protein